MTVLGNLMYNSFMPQSGNGMLGSFTGLNGLGGYGSYGYGNFGGLTGYGETNYNVAAGFAIANALLGVGKQYLTCHAGKVGGSSEKDTNQKELKEVIVKIAEKTEEIASVDASIAKINNTTIPGINGEINARKEALTDAATVAQKKYQDAQTANPNDPGLEALKKAADAASTAAADPDKDAKIKQLKEDLKAENDKLTTLNAQKTKLEGELAGLEEKKKQLENEIDTSTLPKKQSQKIAEKNFSANNRASEKDIMQLMSNFKITTDINEKRAAANKFMEAYNSNGLLAKNINYVRYHDEVQKWLDEHKEEVKES